MAARIVNGAVLACGGAFLLFFWCFYLGMARNISEGGSASFAGVAMLVAIPAFELGTIVGAGAVSFVSDRSATQMLGRMGRLAWVFAVFDFVVAASWGVY